MKVTNRKFAWSVLVALCIGGVWSAYAISQEPKPVPKTGTAGKASKSATPAGKGASNPSFNRPGMAVPGMGGAMSGGGGGLPGMPGMMGSGSGMIGGGMTGMGMAMGSGGMAPLPEDVVIEFEVRQLAAKYGAEADEQARREIRGQVEQKLLKVFDIRHERRMQELQQLEERVAKVRQMLDRRTETKNEIVRGRLDYVLREVEGLGWGDSEANGNYFGEGTGGMGGMGAPNGFGPSAGFGSIGLPGGSSGQPGQAGQVGQ